MLNSYFVLFSKIHISLKIISPTLFVFIKQKKITIVTDVFTNIIQFDDLEYTHVITRPMRKTFTTCLTTRSLVGLVFQCASLLLGKLDSPPSVW